MYRDHVIAAVVPAYREERLIATVITTMPAFVDHIIVVDDASPDATAQRAREVGDARVEVITLSKNAGVGGAVIAGHKRAMELGADVNVVMAGDAQMDPDALPRLLDPVTTGGYGFAKANRFYSSNSFDGMPRHRLFGNIVLTFLTKSASGYWNLVDPQNGYTAIRREALDRIPLDRVRQRYEFENDLLIWLNIANIRAVDVPIPARYGDEHSTIELRHVVPRLIGLMFTGFWRRIFLKYVLWSFSPIALLLFSGMFLLTVGLGFGVFATVSAVSGETPTAGTVLLAVTPFLCGFFLLVQSLVLDILATPD